MARDPEPSSELIEYSLVVEIQMRQHDKAMKPQVGRFGDQRFTGLVAAVLCVFGCQQRFGGFFADFSSIVFKPL
ncbi:hypothetical protein HAALTHF_19280n [Vreelandella aquamarina]|nr:hypothetical protein HAALTHF_19280n [Halomonas axialensis]